MTVSYEMVNELRAEIRRQLALTFTHEGVEMVMNGLAVVNLAEAMRRALEAADAVRGGDAAPPAGTVPVRVAVALDPTDGTASATTIYPGAHGEEHAWSHLRDNRASPVKLCTATIHAPLPAVPEVGAVVEGVDRG